MAYRPAGPWTPPTPAGTPRERIGIEEHMDRAGLHYFPVDAGLILGGRGMGSYPDHFRRRKGLREEAASSQPSLD